MNDLPLVTIIVPCKNEELFIDSCLNSVVKFDYPHSKLELFLVDGLSTDRTIDIANRYVEQYPFMKILTNEKIIFPAAINLALSKSEGDVVVILGAHAEYEPNYISKCVEYLNKLTADNVGGVLNTIGLNHSLISRAITYVLSSSFGVGNSTFRTGSEKIAEVDTVFGGCYRKSVFGRIGNFNENLISTSDMEFNKRLKKSGGKIYLVPEIITTYYTRTSFKKFIMNNFRNGFWAIYPLRFVDDIPVSLRHFIPLFFLLGIIGGVILSYVALVFLYILTATLTLYLLVSFIASLKFIKHGVIYILIIPFLFPLLHLSYGLGSFNALIKLLFSSEFYKLHFSKSS